MLDKDYYAAVSDYDNAVLHGIVKIASKMGISTIQSYQGSKIFEAIGISKEVIENYFTGYGKPCGWCHSWRISRSRSMSSTRRAFDPLDLTVDLNLESRGQHKERGRSGGASVQSGDDPSAAAGNLDR